MRRSICQTEPSFALAGQVNTWKFHYTTATSLPKGSKLKFDIQTKEREIDWEVPSAELEQAYNVIYAEMEDGTILEATEVSVPDSSVPQFEFELPANVKIGHKLIIAIGAPPGSQGQELIDSGNECQFNTQRRRAFNLYIDPKGTGVYEDPEVFCIDIRGNDLDHIRIMTPSFVAKNKRFDITVRFEDAYGNLTANAPEGTLIDLSYEHLRENLNWKLFVPETGFVVLPNLYFNEAGTYRIQLRNLSSKDVYTSAPIKCFNENDRNLFWGLLHGESERVDSTDNIENCLRYYRDEQAINFFASSPFDSTEETSNDIWKLVSQNIADFNEEDRFATIQGFQFKGSAGKEGIRQILYAKDNKPLLRQSDAKSSSLSKIYKASNPKEILSIPSFTMGKGFHFDFKDFQPEFERVVEIYNAWGSSECTKAEGNPRPITGGIAGAKEGSIRAALNKNLRFGFVAGGLDDRAMYGSFYDSDQEQYSPGLTAILSEKYTRETLLQAIAARQCYATTGPRIIVGFHIAGHPMGQELSTAHKPGLAVNRHISGYVAGTSDLKSIEIFRNGELLHAINPSGYSHDYFYDDMEPLEKVALSCKGSDPFAYYYLRVIQDDGHIAWSSPIWIDMPTAKGKK